jgi:hypothetical protein
MLSIGSPADFLMICQRCNERRKVIFSAPIEVTHYAGTIAPALWERNVLTVPSRATRRSNEGPTARTRLFALERVLYELGAGVYYRAGGPGLVEIRVVWIDEDSHS